VEIRIDENPEFTRWQAFFWTNKEKAEFFVYLKIERKNICFEKMKPIFQITFF
jgi:hypothetical protein